MNKEWSQLCSSFQTKIKKKSSFNDGIHDLLLLRNNLFETITLVKNTFPYKGYSKQPFLNAKGYESKTMAYSLFHIFRIEDIVLNLIIRNKEQILFKGGYDKKFPLITTGNELVKEEIRLFSEKIDIELLHKYIKEVYEDTNLYLNDLKFDDLKYKPSQDDVEKAYHQGMVSDKPCAIWLIDYWKTKNVLGFLKMPLSRHWIMHIEAFLRIKNKIVKLEKN